jgi:hypothetical protein
MTHQSPRAHRVCRLALVLCAVVGTALIGTAAARASDSPIDLGGPLSPYSVQMQALTGPAGTDLTIRLADPSSSAAPPTALSQVMVTTARDDGGVDVHQFRDVASPGGVAALRLDAVPRGATVAARLLFKKGEWQQTFVVYAFTRSLLRPDLVVESVTAPKQVLAGSTVDVTAVVAERNGDVGAEAVVGLSALPGSAEHVVVPKSGTTTVTFQGVRLDDPVPVGLQVTVAGATPAETDATNNTTTATVEVTRNELPLVPIVLFPSLAGYGAQFNHHLYAPITQPWMPPGSYVDVEEKVKELQPQLVRIFYNDNWEENQDNTHPEWAENYASFVKVVELAQATGATIDVNYQTVANITSGKRTPAVAMHAFANALEDLARNHNLTNVRWATVANEPNSSALSLDQLYAMNRALHDELVQRGLDGQIKLLGGDLVENAGNVSKNHYEWLTGIAENIGDIVDGYSEHVYWTYDDAGRLEYRLRDTYHALTTSVPEAQRKPMYMMEFGARGYQTCGTKPSLVNRYYRDADCTEIWRTNIAAFQQLWFAIDSAQLGVAGAAKWDAYWAVYDRTSVNAQVYWMTGPPDEGYPLLPTYHALSLLYHATAPGWKILRVGPWYDDDESVPQWHIEGHRSNDSPEQELVSFAGPNGELTVMGLDTNGRSLNTVSTDPPSSYSIGGLPANTAFRLAVWNATGDGTNSIAGTVLTNTAGVARFEVPLQAAFALTTVPVS